MFYITPGGKKILMVQTWIDRKGEPNNHMRQPPHLLSQVLKVFGDHAHFETPVETRDACIQKAADRIIGLSPAIVGFGGTGGGCYKLQRELDNRGFSAEIGYWGSIGSWRADEDAAGFLKGYGVEPPY